MAEGLDDRRLLRRQGREALRERIEREDRQELERLERERLAIIKQRDDEIRARQVQDLGRQRSELIRLRREKRKQVFRNEPEVGVGENIEDDEDINLIRERVRHLEREINKLDIVHRDDDEASVGKTDLDNIGGDLVTLDRFDSVDRELSWLNAKSSLHESVEVGYPEDRIFETGRGSNVEYSKRQGARYSDRERRQSSGERSTYYDGINKAKEWLGDGMEEYFETNRCLEHKTTKDQERELGKRAGKGCDHWQGSRSGKKRETADQRDQYGTETNRRGSIVYGIKQEEGGVEARKSLKDIGSDVDDAELLDLKERYKKLTQEMDEEDEMEIALRDSIERLKIKEEALEKGIEKKEIMRRLKKQKLELEIRLKKEKQNREKQDRLMKLKEQKERLEKSVSEKESALSALEEDAVKPSEVIAEKEGNKERYFYKPKVPSMVEGQFEEWLLEVKCIRDSRLYHEDILKQAIRSSLSGTARRVLLTLKVDATIDEIIDKLKSIYGNVRSEDVIVEELYAARQRENESVSSWGVRLERLMREALEKGSISQSKSEDILKNRFWKYLVNEKLKSNTRIYRETVNTFEELRTKVRKEEEEMKAPDYQKKGADINVAAIGEEKDVLAELMQQMKEIQKQMQELTTEKSQRTEDKGKDIRNHKDRPYRNNYRYRGYFNNRNYGRRGRYTGYKGRQQNTRENEGMENRPRGRQDDRKDDRRDGTDKQKDDLNAKQL